MECSKFQSLRTYLNILCVAASVVLRAGSCGIDSVCVTFRRFFSLLRVLCVNLFGQFFCIFTDDGRVVFDGHFVSASIVSGAAENSLRLQSDGEVSGLLEGECALHSNLVFDLWRRRRGTCVYYLEIC